MRDSRKPARWPAYARVPSFVPVPVRARGDGWTVERQGQFIGLLAVTSCLAAAARGSAYSWGRSARSVLRPSHRGQTQVGAGG